MGAEASFLAFFTHTSMIPEYRNTGNTDQDDADNIGSIIALDDTSDMAMGSVFEDADKHQQGAGAALEARHYSSCLSRGADYI